MSGIVGVIANPIAGKDIRRLIAPTGHTSDGAKIGIIRRIVIAAVESGATQLLLAEDSNQLAARALERLTFDTDVTITFVDTPATRSRLDTIAAAREMQMRGAGAVVVIGGDGTCRDVATGWADVALIALATGTNNVFPTSMDATAAGTAAGLVASGAIRISEVGRRAKRISVHIEDGERSVDDLALVEIALIDTAFIGARAVRDPSTIRTVLAAIASPVSSGLSSIAGRVHPVGRTDPGGVRVDLCPPLRCGVRVPLAPGSFTTVGVDFVTAVGNGDIVTLNGPGVLAFDGERDVHLRASAVVTATIDQCGPTMIDVDTTLLLAAQRRLFHTSAGTDEHVVNGHVDGHVSGHGVNTHTLQDNETEHAHGH